jgi:pyruvate kinase
MTRLARRAGKPVVVATQMLESMIQAPVPTRAEVPTSRPRSMRAPTPSCSQPIGGRKFPVEAVSTMNRIGEEVERDPTYRGVLNAQRAEPEPTVGDAIADAARQIAETSICRRSSAGPVRVRPRSASRASGRSRRRGDHAEPRTGANCHWCGACIAWSRKTRTIWTTWSAAPAASHFATVRQGRPARHHRRRRAAESPGTTNMLRIASVGPDGDAEM